MPTGNAEAGRERANTFIEPIATTRAPLASSFLAVLLKFLAGPFAFAVLYVGAPEGLPRAGQLVVATFAWAIVWWVTQPVPWAATSLLPLIIFPALGVMDIASTAGLYGQTIFFWVMGLALLGYAMEKHGLTKRFAIRFLSIPGVASTTHRLLFVFMLTTGIVSMFVSNSAVVAMMLPIGMSVVSYVRTVAGGTEGEKYRSFANFIALGTLYAAVVGGVGTIAGAPPNVAVTAVLETLTGETIGFFRWMKVGVPLFLLLLVIFYFILRFFSPPELISIPGGEKFLRAEAAKLGKMSRGEKNVLFVFSCMVGMFIAPSIVSVALGTQDSAAVWLRQALSIWTVPPVVMLLLFALPNDLQKREFTLTWKDAVEHSPWNVMLLLVGAVAMTEALGQFGFNDFVTANVTGIGITRWNLPFVAAFAQTALTEMASGTAMVVLLGNILLPVALDVGYNPVSLTILLSNCANGVMFPWSGAPTAIAFASGELDVKNMIKVGFVADGILTVTVALVHWLVSPIL